MLPANPSPHIEALDAGCTWTKNMVIPVDTEKFETSTRGIFTTATSTPYPGKLKLILSSFHEAALITQQALRYVSPGKKLCSPYTTSSSEPQKKVGVK